VGSVQADTENHVARESDLLIERNVPGRRRADDVNTAILRNLQTQSMAGEYVAVKAQLGCPGFSRDLDADGIVGSAHLSR